MKPEDAQRSDDWPDDPDQWTDIEPLDMGFKEAVEKMLKMPQRSIDAADLEND
ncbi:MAG: hypothetical protein OXG67_15315 [bacterium]|nr:hypothetical protein [bacterium]MCY3890869.1 hypothetical protein [bacterium]